MEMKESLSTVRKVKNVEDGMGEVVIPAHLVKLLEEEASGMFDKLAVAIIDNGAKVVVGPEYFMKKNDVFHSKKFTDEHNPVDAEKIINEIIKVPENFAPAVELSFDYDQCMIVAEKA